MCVCVQYYTYMYMNVFIKNIDYPIIKINTVNDLIAAPGALHFQKGGR